ncbi:UDP-N-acetylmuramoylalanine--D-glutamate ligase [hydrothermal vent metagenome]|uniref:UDP-N-acetylmuramoylalanine--D-glutamate ligase n=1 Tax=hydrothermal vent metagenome TaxID=652676 RepID=A0A1W1C1G2_9ZZZZ
MILVYGIGMTGISVCNFLQKKQHPFRVVDNRTNPPLLKDFQNKFPEITIDYGAITQSLLDDIDKVVVSPGIDLNDKFIQSAIKKNIKIIGDMDLFFSVVNAPVIGITGTNGKSTVTMMIADMINNNNKKAVVGGNIGTAVLDCLDDDVDFYVLELSSYQLDITKRMKFEVAIVLNITPDHLERYPSLNEYKKSKLSIYDNAKHKIINLDDNYQYPSELGFGLKIPQKPTHFGLVECHNNQYLLAGDKLLFNSNELKVIGNHNIQNVLSALCVLNSINLLTTQSITALKNFTTLAHRIQFICKVNNVAYINDSKATNTIASIVAIEAINNKYKNIVLLAGGVLKKEDYQKWAKIVQIKVKTVIVFGESREFLKTLLKDDNIIQAKNLKEAVNISKKLQDIDAVLLSPACASFDEFANFEKRGEAFINYVKT